MHRSRTIAGLVVVLLLAGPASAGAVLTTTRDSVSSAGVEGDAVTAGRSSLSSNGRFLAFESFATNLVPDDTNALKDVFLRDRFTGTVTRVSVTGSGAQATGGASANPSVSADGRFVAFESAATNLVSGDTNGFIDIFIRDTFAGTTTRLSVSTVGAQANSHSFRPRISANGSIVAFESFASNLIGGDGGQADIFVRDRNANTTRRVSLNSSGEPANSSSIQPSISADGRFVAFTSFATNLVSPDGNGARDVFIRDRTAATTISATQGANAGSASPDLSGDGRFVAFESIATNLVAEDRNGVRDIFRFDRTNSSRAKVSLPVGAQANGDSTVPSISGDGRFVAYASLATNLVPGDSNAVQDVFVHDTQTDATVLASADPAGGLANNLSDLPGISLDGRFVTFFSRADNLVEGDTNAQADVFTFDRLPPTAATISYGAEGGLSIVDGARDVADFSVFSADGVLTINPFGLTALPLTIGAGCAAGEANGATCAASGVTLLRVELGDAQDFFNTGGCPAELGDATILGGTGDDRLGGGPGFDALRGEAGLDTLSGCGGNDTLDGGTENDLLRGDGGADTFVGGGGTDRADYSTAAGPITVTLDDIANDGAAGESDNVRADVENATGTGAVDSITGSGVRNGFSGGGGNDTLVGGSEPEPSSQQFDLQACNRTIGGPTGIVLSVCGDTLNGDGDNDSLIGQGNDDHLIGGLGVDTFDGGDGDDIISSRDGVQDNRINCGPGSDTANIDVRDEDGLITDSNCETVAASDRREGPNVRIIADRALRLRGGRLVVRLRCPRALRHACRGRLRAGTSLRRAARAPANRYRVAAGRSRILRIRVGKGVRRGRRVHLQAVEKGDVNGLKTTRTIGRIARA